MGVPGTLYLTHDEAESPILLFADAHDNLTVIHAVFDERVFSDTVFRAVKIHINRYIVYDMRMVNGTDVHSTHSYAERSKWMKELLETFHSPDLVALNTVDQVPEWDLTVRGYECYDDAPGTLGVFLPVKE